MRSAYSMSVILLVVVLCAIAPGANARKLVSVQQEFTMDPNIDKDANDLRDYTPQEIAALKELREIKRSRSFITEVLPPYCDFPTWTEGSCCLSFKWQGDKKEACLQAELLLTQLLLRISLLWNQDPLFQHDIALAKFCIGIPGLGKISVCLQIYHLDIDLTETPKFFRICGQILIASVFELRLNCMTITGTSVTFDDSIEPEETGIFTLNFKDGKVVFEFNNPIPPEVMEALRNIGEVIKQKFVDFGRKVVETAKNVWNTIKSWFSWW